MWDLPRPGLEPVSPALAGRLSTTAPPGKPPTIFLLLISSLIPLYDFYSFKFVKVYFMAQNVVYLSECSMWAWEECALCCFWMKKSMRCPLYPVIWWCCWVQLYPYWFFCLLDQSISNRVVEVSNHNSGFIFFSLQFYQFLPHVFWHSVVRCIHVKDYYVFLENWLLYHYVIPLFIPDNLLCSEVCSIWN